MKGWQYQKKKGNAAGYASTNRKERRERRGRAVLLSHFLSKKEKKWTKPPTMQLFPQYGGERKFQPSFGGKGEGKEKRGRKLPLFEKKKDKTAHRGGRRKASLSNKTRVVGRKKKRKKRGKRCVLFPEGGWRSVRRNVS